MVKEKRILSYFLGWLIIGFCILFVGINNVFAEEIQPIEMKSQIRTIYTDGTTQWYTSASNNYTTPLYFGTGPSYSTYGVPCNFRLLVVDNIDTQYSYKYSYDMHIFTPYSTSNTWDSSKIDSQYDIRVGDDQGVVKDSKCTIVNTTKNTNILGTFMNKSISCVFTVNKNQSNAYISAGYFCKGNCNLTNMEPLGYIPQDSYLSIDNVKIERFNDNSNIIIDQNQTIIDQNNTTNEKLDDVQQSIIDSNKETQDVIKDQFNSCRDSINLINNIATTQTINGVTFTVNKDKTITVNGTATSQIVLPISNNITLNGSYILTGCPNGGSSSTYELQFYGTGNGVDYGIGGATISNINGVVRIVIRNGTTLNNLIFKPMLRNSSEKNNAYEPYGEICSNRIDETNDKLDNLQGALTDSSPTDMSGLGNSAGWLPAGPVDSILTLPLTMLNNLVNNLSSNKCQTAVLQLPYVKKNINLPCIKTLYDKIGITGTLFQSAGLIASAFILFNYLLKLYQWVDSTLTMRENTMPGYFDDNWGGGA